MLLHRLHALSFSGELSVGTGIRFLPLFLNSTVLLEFILGHRCLGALLEREILHAAAAPSISRACRDAGGSSPAQQTFPGLNQGTTSASGSPGHDWDQRKKQSLKSLIVIVEDKG